MKVWSVDADDIKVLEHFEDMLLHKTPRIDNFLQNDRSSEFFVIATKGFGKTFLLKTKRYICQNDNKNIPCIPENALLDKPAGSTIFNRDQLEFFSGGTENWNSAWTASIIMATLKRVGSLSDIQLSKKVSALGDFDNVTDFLVNIINKTRDFNFELARECAEKLIPAYRKVHTPLLIFIDNVDEYFNKHIIGGNSSSNVGETSPDIWYFSQLGLMEAIYQLQRLSHHVKIYASIRKETFAKLRKNDPMIQQYMGSSLDLIYSREDLKQIFINNINEDKSLVDPLIKDQHPVRAFLGIDETVHSISGEKEAIFDYILRHTLQRPRDFMSMGSMLSKTRPIERTETKIKALINEVAADIATQYMNEVLPHMDDIEFDNVFSVIDKNVLSHEEIKSICSRYNNISCYSRECKTCISSHVFCNLYKVGLLGIITKDTVTNKYIQSFVLPGERILEANICMPNSMFYLIHPALEARITWLNPKYEDNISKIIIGYNRTWPSNRLPQAKGQFQPKKIVFVAAHPDDEVLSSAGLLMNAFRLGYEITFIWITRGEGSQSPNSTSREAEARKVAEYFTAKAIFLNMNNTDLIDGNIQLSATIKEVDSNIHNIKPHIVVWPFGVSDKQHQDHIVLHKAMQNILGRHGDNGCSWLAAQPPVSSDINFIPTLNMEITKETIDRQYELLCYYCSERNKTFINKAKLVKKATSYAVDEAYDYAEPYILIHGIPPIELLTINDLEGSCS